MRPCAANLGTRGWAVPAPRGRADIRLPATAWLTSGSEPIKEVWWRAHHPYREVGVQWSARLWFVGLDCLETPGQSTHSDGGRLNLVMNSFRLSDPWKQNLAEAHITNSRCRHECLRGRSPDKYRHSNAFRQGPAERSSAGITPARRSPNSGFPSQADSRCKGGKGPLPPTASTRSRPPPATRAGSAG